MPREVTARLGFEGEEREVKLQIPDGKPAPWDLDTDRKIAGTEVPRMDGPEKSTGNAKYTFDVQLPGMLFGKTLRSPHACANVLNVNVDPALEVPGVKAAFSVAPRQVKYVGAEVAVVAAETEAAALEALSKIEVEYEVQPFVIDAAKAREEGAPQVFDNRANVRADNPTERGNVDEAFEGAAHVVQAEYSTQSQMHTSFESHGSVVRWEEDGSLTCWTSTQATFGVRRNLARALQLDLSQVRVLCEHMGGGFGSKFGPGAFTLHAAELAKRTGSPVKMMLDRREELLVGGSRPDSYQKVAFGADADGKLVGAWVTSYGTGGVTGGAGVHNPKIYDFGDNIRKQHENVFTNRAPSCAFRAPGHPQGVFALEGAMDELAEKLGMDPLEFRRKNDSNVIRQREYELGAEAIDWAKNWKPFKGLDPDATVVRGYGLASSVWYNAGRPGSRVAIEMYADGKIVVRNGAQDIGTGTRTLLAIVVAEELGISPDDITVEIGDTNDPPGPASGGSSTAPGLAPVARDAAYMAKKEMIKMGAEVVGRPVEELDYRGGQIVEKESGKPIADYHDGLAGMTDDVVRVEASRDRNYEGFSDTNCGVQFAQVAVDVETGLVKVEKVVAVQDAGMVVDRLTYDSQVIGGVIQGLSFALFEDRLLDPTTGAMVNPDLLHYKIAGIKDMPEIQCIPLEVANGKNSTSTMGVGEPPIISTPGAIANAVYNACGARIRSLPITPWKVLEALGKC